MRIIGIVLVILGALGLGYGGLSPASEDAIVDEVGTRVTAEPRKPDSVPPVFGGIAVVSGLILIASGTRKDS